MIDSNSQFFAILTAVGEAKQANATALGVPWTFKEMGVGDANNTDPIPSRTQTKLINEWRRAPVNQVRTDPANPNVVITEQVIPADAGGRWIREIALYDADGDMVAVANCAPSFKPLLAQGTGKTQIIRMNFIVSNTAQIVLKIDPAVVLATREYVDNAVVEALAKMDFKHSVLVATTANIALSGILTIDDVLLPADARVLVKNQAQAKDNGIYTVSSTGVWKRAQDADSNLEVTPGLFVSVEKGTANGDSIWQLVTDGPITLGTTALAFELAVGRSGVSAGSYANVTVDKFGRVIAGTNPTTLAGHGITDAFTKAEVQAAVAQASSLPVGSMVPFPKGTAPAGFLEADGSVQSIAALPDLAAYLGTTFNTGGEGVGNFRLPDSRGEFLRGWDHGRGIDAGRSIGASQLDQFQGHNRMWNQAASTSGGTRNTPVQASTAGVNDALKYPLSAIGEIIPDGVNGTPRFGTETRPRNLAVMWCIKAWNAPVNQGSIDIAALAARVQSLSVNGPVVGTIRNGRMYIGSPSASATYVADELILATQLGGQIYKLSNFNKTISLTIAGVGGQDIAASVSANGFAAIYAIYNPTENVSGLLAVNATNAKVAEVYGGANMPAGYTASCLLAVVPVSSSLFSALEVVDREVRTYSVYAYATSTIVTNALITVDIIPFNAVSISGTLEAACTAASQVATLVSGGYVPGVGLQSIIDNVPAGGNSVASFKDVGVTAQKKFAVTTAISGSGTATYKVAVSGYKI